MSILDVILDRVSKGMIFPVKPRVPGASAKRALFVVEDLQKMLDSDEGDIEWEARVANLEADLHVFAEGTQLHPKYLFALAPTRDCVWEIRSVQHDPSIRVLGLFAGKDIFVATNYALRSELGGWESHEWKAAKRVALARWRWLFNTYRPVRGTDLTKICTGAIDGRYFK